MLAIDFMMPLRKQQVKMGISGDLENIHGKCKGLSRNDVTLALLNKADTPLPPITFRHFLADPPSPPLITPLCSDI